MCTVSFVPLSNGNYIFTSNRDESPLRKTLAPKKLVTKSNQAIWAPLDAVAGGTWIATDKKERLVCLLNGAFEKHLRKLPYRKSRGKIVLEAFDANNFTTYIQQLNLEQIEPFTLILVDEQLHQLVWDGTQKHITILSTKQAHLWSSATLYNREQHGQKLSYFKQALVPQISPAAVLNIHGANKNTPFILEKTVVRTVSITQLVKQEEEISLEYIVH